MASVSRVIRFLERIAEDTRLALAKKRADEAVKMRRNLSHQVRTGNARKIL
jgi:hypothetical protein